MKSLERILASSKIYEGSRRLIGAESEMRNVVERLVHPRDEMRILDFGCGNGRLVPFVGNAQYIGVDNNPSYIDAARQQYNADNVSFICADLNDLADMGIEPVDVVVCIGVLHHLDDGVAERALSASCDLLKDDGRLITMDPCFEPTQHSLARVLMALDRGKYVRHPEGYRHLISERFDTERSEIWHDIYKFPYTHFVTVSTPKSVPAIVSVPG